MDADVDTLFLYQALRYDTTNAYPGSDGRPNALDVHAGDQGELVWFGFPLYYFEPDQARQVTSTVLRMLGVERLPRGVRTGPQAARPGAALTTSPAAPPAVPPGVAARAPKLR